jgi:hypothetical protein
MQTSPSASSRHFHAAGSVHKIPSAISSQKYIGEINLKHKVNLTFWMAIFSCSKESISDIALKKSIEN